MPDKNYQDRLGVSRLDSESKSDLYKRFEKVGGKVVQAADPKAQDDDLLTHYVKMKERAEEQKASEVTVVNDYAKKTKRQRSSASTTKNKKSQKQIKQTSLRRKSIQIKIKKKDNAPISYLASKLVCIFSGIFNLVGTRIHRRFFRLVLGTYKNMLEENKPLLTPLLYQDSVFSKLLRKRLDKEGRPYYFEILYRADNLYDELVFQKLFEITRASGNILKARKPMMELFKRIHVLYAYRHVIKDAVRHVLFLERDIKTLNERMVKSNIVRLERSLDFIFGKFYSKTHTLLEFYHKLYLVNGGKEDFDKFLNIQPEDQMGHFTHLWKQQEEEEEKQKKEEEDRVEREAEARKKHDEGENIDFDQLSLAIQKGLKLINRQIHFAHIIRNFRKENDPRGIFTQDDKVFLISSLLDFFDQQFSFVYLGGKAEYNVFSEKNGSRIDIKNTLKDLHTKIGLIYKKVREYVSGLEDRARIHNNPQFSNRENNPQLVLIHTRLKDALKFVGYETRKIVDSFIHYFAYIISDYKQKRRVLQNPNERVHFKAGVGEKPLLDNLKIIDVVVYGYYYLSAFKFLLTDSDLRPYQLRLKSPHFLIFPVESKKEEDYHEEPKLEPEKTEFVGETKQGISLEKPIDLK